MSHVIGAVKGVSAVVPAGLQDAPAGPQEDPAGPQEDPAGPQEAPAGLQGAPAGWGTIANTTITV